MLLLASYSTPPPHTQLLISIVWNVPFLWGVSILFRGYDKEGYEYFLRDKIPKRMKLRWAISSGVRLIEGVFQVVAIFMLIMRADTGLLVILSFASTTFIADTSQQMYHVLSWSIFGKQAKVRWCLCLCI